MRRLLVLFLVAACLLPEAGTVRAQATADQLNRLSLEALTTPAPGGNPGSSYRGRAAHRSFYRGVSRSRRSYAYRGSGRRVARPAYRARRGAYRTAASRPARQHRRHATYQHRRRYR